MEKSKIYLKEVLVMNDKTKINKWRKVLADVILYILTTLTFVMRVGYAIVFLCSSIVILIPLTTACAMLKKDISFGKAFLDAFESCLQEFNEIIKY